MSKSKGGSRRYTPMLKWKRGELWALSKLKESTKGRVVPLLDFLPHPEKSTKEHAEAQAKALARSWGSRPAFIDTVYAGTQGAMAAKDHETVFKAIKSRGCEVIPVTALGRSSQYQAAVKAAASDGDNGVMIRLAPRDFTDPAQLSVLLNNLTALLALPKSEIDILIDYSAVTDCGIVTQLMRLHVSSLPSTSQWRTLTTSSGCFPSSLKSIGLGNWHPISRTEWHAWRGAASAPMSRIPNYADYGIRDPGPPPQFGRASANLRYTTTTDYLCRLGNLVKDGGAQQMYSICKSLTDRPEYRGPAFSAGDEAISVTAASSNSSGGPQQWVQWCMNHHFETVADQLDQLHAA